MKKMSFILILTFLLFACATPAKYDSKLNRLVGVSKSQLIKDMGQPSATKVFANGDEGLGLRQGKRRLCSLRILPV